MAIIFVGAVTFTSCQKQEMEKNYEAEQISFTTKKQIITSLEKNAKSIETNYTIKDDDKELTGTLYTIKNSLGEEQYILVLDKNSQIKDWWYERNSLTYNSFKEQYNCDAPGPKNCTRLFGGWIVIMD